MSLLPIPAGLGWHLAIPELDFETYSESGHHWDEARQRYTAPPPVTTSKKKGLPTVGAAKYAMHPSTEILSAQYNLLDGHGNTLWIPDLPKPERLIEHVLRGGLLEAWNAGFEYWVWQYVATRRYGWPAIGMRQFRCAMAKARAFSLPGKLEEAGRVLALPIQKDAEGKRLLKLFSEPRTPTKKDPRHRILPSESPTDAAALYRYNGTDIDAERAVSEVTPDLDGLNLDYWFADQDINRRGVHMDAESIRAATLIVNEAHERYNIELREVTTGAVSKASELAKLVAWMHGRGVHTDTLDEDVISALLETELPDDVRRALEIRAAIGSAAVKKLYAMADQLAPTGRLHDLFSYHAARTGRPTGNGPQPTNLPKAGPKVHECEPCGRYFGGRMLACPHCGALRAPGKPQEWSPEAAEDALEVIRTGSLDALEYVFGDAMLTIAGCLRGLFVAAPGHDLIASDYSAIEAVVLAALAGVEWRLEVFRTHGRIYEDSVARITGTPFAEIMAHAGYDVSKPEWWLEKQSGPHHTLRQTVGKVSELASGFGGWVGAWKAFGADSFMTDDEIKTAVLAWREASPEIVEFWGGQRRYVEGIGLVYENFGVEGAFVSAMTHRGQSFTHRGISFVMQGDAVFCTLLSGRHLTYHRPRLEPSDRTPGTWAISFESWNTNPKQGPMGWVTMRTWGGKLTENIVQATAHDLQRSSILNQEAAGYPIVMHIYDENVSEVPHGFGSIQEFERLMMLVPKWAEGWPVKAAGGWRGGRYRKA